MIFVEKMNWDWQAHLSSSIENKTKQNKNWTSWLFTSFLMSWIWQQQMKNIELSFRNRNWEENPYFYHIDNNEKEKKTIW